MNKVSTLKCLLVFILTSTINTMYAQPDPGINPSLSPQQQNIAGISASGGSACSSGTNIGSHVLNGIQANPNRPAVRFSFSKFNTREEIDYVVLKLKELCHAEV